jgi:hypothetical protein
MRHAPTVTLGLALLATAFVAGPARSQSHPATPEKKYEDFDKVVKGAKEIDGLFKLWRKDEQLLAEIKPQQLDRPFLCPIAIARGMGMGGLTLNFDEQWVLLFKKVGDHKIYVIRRNVHFRAKPGSPVAGAVETTYSDSVLLSLKILSVHPQRQSILISLNDIFMRDFAGLGMGGFDSSRSTWDKIKAFPRNIELRVAATFTSGGRGFFSGDDSVIDARGNTVVVHYGLVELPDGGYQPRLADDRVGYFLSAVKDFSSDSKDSAFIRYVNRWRLDRADTDPKNKDKLSVPRKRIVFWIEKTVPHEYRAYVRVGILEWNKAFAKVGFRDAIEVRQQENEDFDPEDMNYNTFRWITTGAGFAMGPSRANPLTGEILDADIIFDADMVRFFKQEHKVLGGGASLDEFASPIQALKRGWGLPEPFPARLADNGPNGWDDRRPTATSAQDSQRWAVQQGLCQCATCMRHELGLAALTLGARGQAKGAEKVPEELVGQAIKMVVMHEVGHTLGLRHNFKASTMLPNEKLHDTSITRVKGLSGSVMDYLPVNLAPKGTKQGDYFTTTIGPYDYWAIEYAYKPLDGGTDGEWDKLQEIAKHGALPGLDYGTDEDLYGTADPLIHAFDLGADPMKFAQGRVLLAEELLKDLSDKVVDKGEGYQRVRQAFSRLLNQHGNAAFLVASYVGGEYAHRDHAGDPAGRDPFLPVPGPKQREALKFLQEHVLSDKHFQFPPQLLRRLAADHWMHWGTESSLFGSTDYPLHERVLGIQRIVLNELLSGRVLARIQNNALKAEKDQPLRPAEVFRALTDSVWNLPKGEAKVTPSPSVIRRNLQRAHLTAMANMVLGPRQGGGASVPPDARSLARMHLREIKGGIEAVLGNGKAGLDETTRAHLEECQERITRVLSASTQVNTP